MLVSYSGDGGVERMTNNLVAGLLATGCRVDVVALKCRGRHFAAMPKGARLVRLPTGHAALAAPFIARYLRRVRPRALLVAKDRAARAAVRARAWADGPTRLVLRVGNTLSQTRAGRSGRGRRALRRLYPRADAIVAVSKGVAEDLIALTGVASERVHVIANPTIPPDIAERAAYRPEHPWLTQGDVPVILAIGRLAPQKDYATLLRAFARLRDQRDARLIIVGEGEERSRLERLAADLAVAGDVALPGFVANPYPWLRCAALFVLSSAWEGSPNALTEAMHLGRPVVATDCPSGPREVLDGGRIAPLVPVGDDGALARAMAAALDQPQDAAALREAVAAYQPSVSTARYLEVLGIAPAGTGC